MDRTRVPCGIRFAQRHAGDGTALPARSAAEEVHGITIPSQIAQRRRRHWGVPHNSLRGPRVYSRAAGRYIADFEGSWCTVKPPPFQYHAPRTVDEAVELLDRYSDSAKVLAGGQSMVPLLNLRLANVEHLIDLNTIDGLTYISNDQDHALTIGATARQRAVEQSSAVTDRLAILQDALSYVGHMQIRNRGTVVGSICHADPAAEMPALWLAVGGEATIVATSGKRKIDADSFFASYFTTSVQPNELVTEVTFNVANSATGHSINEVARRHGDFALAGVVAQVTLDDDRKAISDARIALFGVAGTPVRAGSAERLLKGRAADDEAWAAAADAVDGDISPTSDVHASEEYRRQVARVLTQRSLREAAERAAGQPQRGGSR
ncbi:MAG TPA: xanthine dehydrogenase family protein subunit M [Solirubrobacteraceae bacterium]